jgi:hypothetical protein
VDAVWWQAWIYSYRWLGSALILLVLVLWTVGKWFLERRRASR